jgi:uncharacterized protein (TIRG00374 family)
MRKWLFVVGSVVVSAVLLWLTLRDVPLDQVWATIQRSNMFWIVVSFLTVGGALFTRGVRWNVMLGGRVGVRPGFYIFSVTMLLNQLPLRAGEVVRVLLATRYQVPVMTAAASVIVERLIDVVIVVVIIAIGLTQLPDVPAGVAQTAALFGAGAVAAFVVLIGFALRPALGHRLALWLEKVLPFLRRFKLQQQVDAVLAGLRPLTHMRTFALTALWTVIAWSFSLATFMALARAIDLQGTSALVYAMIGVGLAALGVAIPLTLASIGPFQGAVRVAGEMLLVDAVASAALGLLFHGVTLLAYAVFGVIGIVGLGVSAGDLFSSALGGDKPKAELPAVEEA